MESKKQAEKDKDEESAGTETGEDESATPVTETATSPATKRYEEEEIANFGDPSNEDEPLALTEQRRLEVEQSLNELKEKSRDRTESKTSNISTRNHTNSHTNSQTNVQTNTQANTSNQDSTIRVSSKFLDELLTFTGNMVMARNQLLTRYNFQGDQSFATLSRSITDVHKGVVQQRMQTVGALFGRFHRVVRDLSKKLGKEVDLIIEGEDIELDRSIMEAFNDPLTHMVRNAMDHAIETPEVRMAAGKSRVGRLTLRAYHQSGEVIVEIEDDGAGIDADKVAAKAIAKGLARPEQIAKWSPGNHSFDL